MTSTEMPVLRGALGRLDRAVHERADRDHRHVGALADRARLAERDRLELVRHLALDRVEQPVLEEDHGVVVVDRRPEQAAHVLGGRRVGDLEPRHVHEPRLELLRVLRARRPAGTALRADRQRHLDLAARHVAVLGRLVDDLLERERQEVLVHDLDDRAHARHRRADARADDRHLGDRRVAHALRAELVEQPLRDAHRAAHLGDVLAHDEDVVVLAHRAGERVADGLAVGDLRHRRSSGRLRAAGRCRSARTRARPRRSRAPRASKLSNSSSARPSRLRSRLIGSCSAASSRSSFER